MTKLFFDSGVLGLNLAPFAGIA